jgi:hypothetical protein
MKTSLFSSFLFSFLILVTASDRPCDKNGKYSQDFNQIIGDQQKLITSLQTQIDTLTITPEKISIAATNVRSVCAADFQKFCQQSEIMIENIFILQSDPKQEKNAFDSNIFVVEDPTISNNLNQNNFFPNFGSPIPSHNIHHEDKPQKPRKLASSDSWSFDFFFKSSASSDSSSSSSSSSSDSSSSSIPANVLFTSTASHPFHDLPIGFNSLENEMCMMSHIMELSSDCQSAINEILELNEDYIYQQSNTVEMEYQTQISGLGIFFLLLLVILPCIAYRRHRRFMKMRKFIAVMYENPEVRSVVEGIVGEPLPPQPKCCRNSRPKKFICRSILAWLIISLAVGIFFVAAGVPADLVLTGILSGTIHLIVLVLICVTFVKLIKCCCCCFRKRNHSNQCSSGHSCTNQFPGQNRLNLEHHMIHSSELPFQYQQIPMNENTNTQSNDSSINSSTNQHSRIYFENNNNPSMIYAGIPVTIPPNV